MSNNNNKWFKHFNGSSLGQSLSVLVSNQDYETIFFWWWLLEKVSLWEDYNRRGVARITSRMIKNELGWNRQRFLRLCSSITLSLQVNIQYISDSDSYDVSIPNWLKYQETRGGKRITKKEQSADRLKTEDIRQKTKDLRSNKFEQEIESIYNSNYPLKKGKTKGIKKLAKEIKSEEDLEKLKKAVVNYSTDRTGSEPQFIKHFSTFAGEWKDWVDLQPHTDRSMFAFLKEAE